MSDASASPSTTVPVAPPATAATRTPVPPRWNVSMLPNIPGKVVIVSGAGTGIGFHTALELARRGAHVVLACHLEAQGKDAETEIREEILTSDTRGTVEYMHLDVSDLASIRTFTMQFQQTHDRLDVLINNAGIVTPQHTMTSDGYELEFATNYLGPFALTCQLLDLMKKNPDQARILTVSSVLHKRVPAFNVEELMVTDPAKFNRIQAYARTKLYVLLFAFELQRRLEAQGIRNVIAVGTHPGVVSTNMMDTDLWDLGLKTYMAFKIAGKFMHTPDFGALPILYAAACPGVRGGEYYGPDGVLSIYGHPTHDQASALAQSEDNAKQLWTKSEEMAKVVYDL